MSIVSDRLRALRAERRLDQKEVASATGISYSSIQKYESGVMLPPKLKQQVLADFFGVSLTYLRGETNDRGNGVDIYAFRDSTTKGIPLDEAIGLVEQVEKLSKLHSEGKLTDEEFAKLKRKIIG